MSTTEMEKTSLALVTGGTGYLACHVVKEILQSTQYLVRATVRNLKIEKKVKPLRDLCPVSESGRLEIVEADLGDPQSWLRAVNNCTYVIHTASPFPWEPPETEDEVIKPAVEGTLNVLRAAHTAGTVKRVVLTSSVAAVMTGVEKSEVSEEDWSVVSRCGVYTKSKTLAEKAAWDFVQKLPDKERFELSVMNPGLILGPPLTSEECTSVTIIKRIMMRKDPMVPKLHLLVVDVRDAALAHVRALTVPSAAGKRHLLAPNGVWFKDIALILARKFDPLGFNVPTKEAPYFVMWLASIFNSTAASALPMLGKKFTLKSTRMTDVLQVQPRDLQETLISMAEDLIQKEIIPRRVS